jgi:WD40 repeat protein
MKNNRIGLLLSLAIFLLPQSGYCDSFSGLFNNTKDVASEVAVLNVVAADVASMDFSPDGKHLAVDSRGNGGTDIWDIEEERIVSHLPESGVTAWYRDVISYSPNGQQLAICHGQGESNINIDVYDTSSWATIHSVKDAEKRLNGSGGCEAITFTPDGKELIRLAGSYLGRPGNNVIFYDTSSWQVTRGFRTVPLIDDTNTIRDPINWTLLETPNMLWIDPDNKKTEFNPGTLSISKDGKFLALAGTSIAFGSGTPFDQSEVVIVDISNQAIVHVIHGQAESSERMLPVDIHSLDWSPDNIHVAFGPIDNNVSVQIYDTSRNNTVVSEDTGPSYSLVRYTPDGKYLIENVGKKVEIWDGKHQNLLQVIKAQPSYIAVSRNGRFFAIGGHAPSIADINPLLSLTFPGHGRVFIYELK